MGGIGAHSFFIQIEPRQSVRTSGMPAGSLRPLLRNLAVSTFGFPTDALSGGQRTAPLAIAAFWF
jgi:hypothetical protein